VKLILKESVEKDWSKTRIICENHGHTRELPDLALCDSYQVPIISKSEQALCNVTKEFYSASSNEMTA